MEGKVIKSLIVLGIPGVSLGIFFLLLDRLNFTFSEVPPLLSGAIAIVFILVVGGVTVFALHRWSPKTNSEPPAKEKKEPFTFSQGEVTVTFEEKMRSLAMDVVKVNAHDHILGVVAEYEWLAHHYPTCERKGQVLTTLELVTKSAEKYDSDQVYFDRLTIELDDGREKNIYFDISGFFRANGSSLILDPDEFAAKKLAEIYSD